MAEFWNPTGTLSHPHEKSGLHPAPGRQNMINSNPAKDPG